MKPGRKKTGHFQTQPYRRAAGEARLVKKRPKSLYWSQSGHWVSPRPEQVFWVTQQRLLHPFNSEQQGQWTHPCLSSPLFSLLPPCPQPQRKTLRWVSWVSWGPGPWNVTVRGSSGRSAKNRWHGILEPHCYPPSAHSLPVAAPRENFWAAISLCTEMAEDAGLMRRPKGFWETKSHLRQRSEAVNSVRGFPGGPVFKNLPWNSRGLGSIPGQGTKIPHAAGQLTYLPLERNNIGLMLPNKHFIKKKKVVNPEYCACVCFKTQGTNEEVQTVLNGGTMQHSHRHPGSPAIHVSKDMCRTWNRPEWSTRRAVQAGNSQP